MINTTKKQIKYPTFFKRIMATIMDLLLFSTLFTPLITKINQWIFLKKFGDVLKAQDVDLTDGTAIMEAFKTPEMAQYLNMSAVLEIVIPMTSVHLLFMAVSFVICWNYFGATPIKYLLGMRIVDQDTYAKPKLINLIWRCIGYSLCLVGMWWIFFTERKQALHDKLGRTVVIKI
jgi:uncharacterized RDD family membrane protein YckC